MNCDRTAMKALSALGGRARQSATGPRIALTVAVTFGFVGLVVTSPAAACEADKADKQSPPETTTEACDAASEQTADSASQAKRSPEKSASASSAADARAESTKSKTQREKKNQRGSAEAPTDASSDQGDAIRESTQASQSEVALFSENATVDLFSDPLDVTSTGVITLSKSRNGSDKRQQVTEQVKPGEDGEQQVQAPATQPAETKQVAVPATQPTKQKADASVPATQPSETKQVAAPATQPAKQTASDNAQQPQSPATAWIRVDPAQQSLATARSMMGQFPGQVGKGLRWTSKQAKAAAPSARANGAPVAKGDDAAGANESTTTTDPSSEHVSFDLAGKTDSPLEFDLQLIDQPKLFDTDVSLDAFRSRAPDSNRAKAPSASEEAESADSAPADRAESGEKAGPSVSRANPVMQPLYDTLKLTEANKPMSSNWHLFERDGGPMLMSPETSRQAH